MVSRAASALILALTAALVPPPAAAQDWIDFGDDAGRWALDDECDDPRFYGRGMYGSILDDHRGHDATDCRAGYEGGQLQMRSDIINFGSDSGRMAQDGVCDDLRFEGETMRKMLFADHIGNDGSDCRKAWDAGEVALRIDNIVFGEDSGDGANDGECADARFQGPGMARPLPRGREGRDATDCRAAYLAGTIEPSVREGLYDVAVVSVFDGIDFGDNSSVRSQDGVCDDPRFAGAEMRPEDDMSPEDKLRDASDCASAYIAGRITLASD